LDRLGLLDSLVSSATDIDVGRKGLATDGKEHEGRIFYEDGIAGALAAFQEAKTITDPQTFILAELVFLKQELQFCSKSDNNTKNSLTQAVESFNDALRSLKAVQGKYYRTAEETYPQNPKYRFRQMPKDAFHLACIAHRTRIQNILRVPGMNMTEKAVYQQRLENMTIAQNSYFNLQKKVLVLPEEKQPLPSSS
jgi:hypothetical protein